MMFLVNIDRLLTRVEGHCNKNLGFYSDTGFYLLLHEIERVFKHSKI